MSNLAYLETEETTQEGFCIDSDQKAEWAIRAIKEDRAETQRMVDLCDTQIDFYMERMEQAKKDLVNKTSFLEGQLAAYFETLPKKATKTQEKMVFPSGELIRKFEKQDFARDDKSLIKTLKDTEYVVLEPKLKWAELKKDLEIQGEFAVNKTTGEVVEGITIIDKPATFEVK